MTPRAERREEGDETVVPFPALALLSLLFSPPAVLTAQLETAFLQNSAAAVRPLLTRQGALAVSLPEPVSLSDQLSPDQTYLVLNRLFKAFKTTEFISEPRLSALPGRRGGILKARWSLRNERTGAMVPLRIYIYLAPEAVGSEREERRGVALRIVEIRAERL